MKAEGIYRTNKVRSFEDWTSQPVWLDKLYSIFFKTYTEKGMGHALR